MLAPTPNIFSFNSSFVVGGTGSCKNTDEKTTVFDEKWFNNLLFFHLSWCTHQPGQEKKKKSDKLYFLVYKSEKHSVKNEIRNLFILTYVNTYNFNGISLHILLR